MASVYAPVCGPYTLLVFTGRVHRQCRINHVAGVANATGLKPQGGLRK